MTRDLQPRMAAFWGGMMAVALQGCGVVSTVGGIAVGVATGTITSDPVAGAAVTIAVKAGIDEAGRQASRHSQHQEQQAIAASAGMTRVGDTTTWAVRRFTGRVEHGEVRVLRAINTPLATCKELLFAVDTPRTDESPAWFKGHTCYDGAHWQWAVAEPAVARWGVLQ